MGLFENTDKYHYSFFILAGLNISLNYMFYTYSTGIMDIILKHIFRYVYPSNPEFLVTFIASSVYLSALFGSLTAGPLATKLGRRKLLMIADVFAVFGVLLALLPSLAVMIIGRLIVGFTIGIVTVVNPLYFTEMAPLDYRGPISLGSCSFMSIGMFLAFLGGFFMPDYHSAVENNTWRILLGVSIAFPIFNLINFTLFFREETPTHYVFKDRIEEAKQTLQKIYKQGANERLYKIQKEKNYIAPRATKVKFRDLFTKKYRLACFVAIVVMFVQQIAGYEVFSVYITEIFEDGMDPNDHSMLPLILSLVFAFIHMISEILLIFFSYGEKNKPPLVTGSILSGVCLLLFGVLGLTVGLQSFWSKIFLLLWPLPMAYSLGHLPYLVTPETLPPIAESVAFTTHWLFAFLAVQFFPTISSGLGVHRTLIIMGVVVIFGAIFLAFTLVETEEKNKDEILKEYKEEDDEVSHLNPLHSS